MPRRAPGIRTRHLKDGTPRYEATAYDPKTKQKKSLGTFATVREARAAKAEFEATAGSGRSHEMTFEEWGDIWTMKRGLSASTIYHYEMALRPFLEDFGEMSISSLSPERASLWASRHSSAQVDVVRNFINRAIERGLADRNPFSGLGRKKSKGRADMLVPGDKEVALIAESAFAVFDGNHARQMRALVLLTAKTGLRKSEAIAVRWSSIVGDDLHIGAQVDRHGKLREPKKDSSRVVPIIPEVRALLDEIDRRDDDDDEFIFRGIRGQPLSQGTLHHNWDRMRLVAGFAELVFHALRHHFGTWAYRNLRDAQVVAELMGHKDGGQLVLALYSHLSQEAAVESFRRKALEQGGLSPLMQGGGIRAVQLNHADQLRLTEPQKEDGGAP